MREYDGNKFKVYLKNSKKVIIDVIAKCQIFNIKFTFQTIILFKILIAIECHILGSKTSQHY